jgi:hypothetical protein
MAWITNNMNSLLKYIEKYKRKAKRYIVTIKIEDRVVTTEYYAVVWDKISDSILSNFEVVSIERIY